MIGRHARFALVFGYYFACHACLFAQPTPAETVFLHGGVYTVDAARSWTTAVAVQQGRIVYVGTDEGASAWIGKNTRVVDLTGKMLLPGFHDSHIHLIGGGIELEQCNINGMTTIEQILDKVRQYAAERPHEKWIQGGGWLLTIADGNPHKSRLDEIVSDRPVVLDAFDGHSIWVNSRALEIAGITKETPDPPRGRIERDPTTGEPTGTLREAASKLVRKKIPPATHEESLDGLRRGLKMANQFGITSVQDASVNETHLKAFAELDRAGELTVKAVAAMRIDPERHQSQISEFVRWRNEYTRGRVRATAVKIFEDGVIESQTAALFEAYLNNPTNRGWLNIEPEELKPLAAQLDQLGFQIHIHAIGDRAINASLDSLEFARSRNGPRDSRHHIAHIQLFQPSDILRFQQLGVIANFQPLWARPDEFITKMTEPVLGPSRSRWLYPIRSLVNTGAVIVCGSDWSVTSMNPLEAIQVAVTRRDLTDGPGPAWLPEELADLPTMIAGYTINGAYLAYSEKETGSIEIGKAADLVVLNQNLFDTPIHLIHEVNVVSTFVDGREVYSAKAK